MKTKKASRPAKKTARPVRKTAVKKSTPSAKKKPAAPSAKKKPAAPRAKPAGGALGDKYRQSGAPWWKAFL